MTQMTRETWLGTHSVAADLRPGIKLLTMLSLALLAAPATAQVASVLTLGAAGEVTTLVRNPSVVEAVRVTIALHHGSVVDKQVVLEREVGALVAPATFTLTPGESQTVRIRVREAVPAGTVLRLVTTFTPTAADAPAPGSETAPVARVIMATRLITKVMVP